MADGPRHRWAVVPLPDGLVLVGLDGGGEDGGPQSCAELRLKGVGAWEVYVLCCRSAEDLQDGEEANSIALADVLPRDVLDQARRVVPARREG